MLVVEDEKNLNRIISEAMEDEGYSVDSCFNGLDGLDYARAASYDVIILDINMPKLNGLDMVRRLRAEGDTTPVLFLTARDSVSDKVEGLESVVRVMTRKYTGNRSNVYTLADLTIDTASKSVKRAGKSIDLTAKEFSLLEYMMRNRGVVLSREMIEDNLWNYDYEGGTNIVDVYVGYLRKKMDTGFDKKLIHTVWGSGWVLKE